MRMDDPRLNLSDDEQLLRGQRVADGLDAAQTAGCHGVPGALSIRPYTSANNLCIVPVAHAMLYGVVAAFVGYVLRPMPKVAAGGAQPTFIVTRQGRVYIRRMAKCTQVPSDYGRIYKCVYKYRCDACLSWL